MFDAADLSHMRTTQTDHMQDTCVVLSYAAGVSNEFGEKDSPTYTEQAVTVCGLDMRPGFERHGQTLISVQYDATLRLPIGAQIKETDLIRIVSRFDEPVEDMVYQILSPIQRGPSGIRVVLGKVVL
jgi:hypothetical protein